MMPSSEPLWASIGPRTTSPMAQTFNAVVRHSSSTSMKPLARRVRRRRGDREDCRSFRPAAHRNDHLVYRDLVTAVFVFVFQDDARTPSTSVSRTIAPRRISRPCFLNCRWASSRAIWPSAMNRNRSIASRIVTCGAEALPYAAELQADHAARRSRPAVPEPASKLNAPVRVDDSIAVVGRRRQLDRRRTRRENDMIRFEEFGRAIVRRVFDGRVRAADGPDRTVLLRRSP